MKVYKVLVPVVALALCFSAVSFADSESGREKALRDYKQSQESKSKMLSSKEKKVISDLKLSDFSIDMYHIKSANVITEFDGTNISEILTPSEEKLSFMMNGEEAEGIIIATESEPVLMGGINKSKNLFKVLKSLKKEMKQGSEIRYFEFQGGGIFLTEDDKKEVVYLSERAAAILDLEEGKKYKSEAVLEKMKEKASNTSTFQLGGYKK